MTDHCNARYSMALYACVDAMRRCDPEYAAAHGVRQTTDAEWDHALEWGEDMLDELSTDDAQLSLFPVETLTDPYVAQTERLEREAQGER
jgi:hypothetical protein